MSREMENRDHAIVVMNLRIAFPAQYVRDMPYHALRAYTLLVIFSEHVGRIKYVSVLRDVGREKKGTFMSNHWVFRCHENDDAQTVRKGLTAKLYPLPYILIWERG